MSTKTTQSEKQKIPKLRFAGFDGGWEEKKLGDVAIFLKGKGISKDDISEVGKNKCIRYGELYTTYSEIINEVKSKTNISSDESLLSKKNDLLIPSSGETALDIATVSCVKEDNILLGGDLNVIRLKEKQDGNFFAYYLSNFQDKQIAELAQGNSVVHLYSSSLKTLKVNLPSLSEQQKIAGFLGGVDEWIENLKKEKENFELYKKAMMQKLFSQQIRFKDDKGNEFPEWEEEKLGEVLDFLSDYTANGSFASLKENVKYFSTNNYAALVRTTDLEKEIFEPQRFTDKRGYDFLKKTSLRGDELILSNVGNTGKIYKAPIYDGLMTLAPNTYVLKFKDCIDQEYIYQWMLTDDFISKVGAIVGGGGLKAINKSNLRSVHLQTPCFLEQQKIADFLTSLDIVIQSKQQQISQAEQWKKGLMQGLFV